MSTTTAQQPHSNRTATAQQPHSNRTATAQQPHSNRTTTARPPHDHRTVVVRWSCDHNYKTITWAHALPIAIAKKSHSYGAHMAGGASEPQSRSSERPRHTESVTIPSSYWHFSAPLQTNISKSCYYQGSCWRPSGPSEHGTRGRARKFAELWALLAKQEDEDQMIKTQEQLPDV